MIYINRNFQKGFNTGGHFLLGYIHILNFFKRVTYLKKCKLLLPFHETLMTSSFYKEYKKRINACFSPVPTFFYFFSFFPVSTRLPFRSVTTFSTFLNKQIYNCKNQHKNIQIIENEENCEKAINEINKHKIIALDFEGTNLGKYGKICTMQVYTEIIENELNKNIVENYYIFDLLKLSVQKKIKKIIENNKTLKVVHDCREDSSALYNQLGIKLQNVYDLLKTHMLLLEKEKKNDIYQIGFSKLLKDYLGIEDENINNLKKKMYTNEKIWEMRPLSKASIIYAFKNVKYLIPLYKIFSQLIPENEVVNKSKDFINYCFLNNRYKLPEDLAKRGNIVEAMLVSKTMLTCVFKLNSTRKGIACTPSTVAQFRDVKVGDVVICVVSNKSIDQKILYLCKYDSLYDYWNLKKRPREKFKPSIHDNDADPLISKCHDEYCDIF